MTKNPLSQLSSLGEDFLGKAAQNPKAAKLVGGVLQLKDRVDDLGAQVRGLEGMQKRIDSLEKRLAKLETTTRSAAKRKPAAKAAAKS